MPTAPRAFGARCTAEVAGHCVRACVLQVHRALRRAGEVWRRGAPAAVERDQRAHEGAAAARVRGAPGEARGRGDARAAALDGGEARPLRRHAPMHVHPPPPRTCIHVHRSRAAARVHVHAHGRRHVVSDDLIVNNIGVSAAYQSPPHFDVNDIGSVLESHTQCMHRSQCAIPSARSVHSAPLSSLRFVCHRWTFAFACKCDPTAKRQRRCACAVPR